jgi:Tfp pilus assembly protein PilZ
MPQAPMQPLTDLTAPPPPPPPPAPVAAAPPPAPSAGMPTAPAAPPPPPPEAEGDANQKAWIRRHTRVRLDGTVTVEDYGTFTSFDISEGGLFIVANTPIPFGTDVKLHIESAAFPKPLDMTGIVIREGLSEAGETGFAIQFTRVNPAHRRVLQDYVKQKLGQ